MTILTKLRSGIECINEWINEQMMDIKVGRLVRHHTCIAHHLKDTVRTRRARSSRGDESITEVIIGGNRGRSAKAR
jgi:hypothetical protein